MTKSTNSRRRFIQNAGLGAAGILLSKTMLRADEPSQPQSANVYIGTYTSGKSEGIYRYTFDRSTGELKPAGVIKGVINPSFVAVDHKRKYLYAVNEVSDFGGKKSGAISSFAINHLTGDAIFINQQASLGADPCHITIDRNDKFVLVANYTGGNLSVFPLHSNGSIGKSTDLKQDQGSSANKERQEGPHAHCIKFDRAERFAYLCDLGTDKIMIFRFDATTGKLSPNQIPWVSSKPGAGPRHLVFHPIRNNAYLINELDTNVVAFDHDATTGELKEIQALQTLPADYSGSDTGAEIDITPNGKFLYCSNRGHDSIAAYSIDQQTGKLTFVAHQSTMGKTPRHFAIDPSGKFMIVANQNSDNLVTFRIDQASGKLFATGHVAEVPSPVCVAF